MNRPCMHLAQGVTVELMSEEREAYSRRVVWYEDARTAERLERTAIARGHSVGAEVREAVRDHLRRLEERSVQGGTP